MRTSLRALRPALGTALIFLITSAQLALLTGCGGPSNSPVAPSASAPVIRASEAVASTPAAVKGPVPVFDTASDVTLNGHVANLEGSCPGLSMSVDGTPVTTNGA